MIEEHFVFVNNCHSMKVMYVSALMRKLSIIVLGTLTVPGLLTAR